MNYNELKKEIANCQEKYKQLSRPEKQSEEGIQLLDNIRNLKTELDELQDLMNDYLNN